MEVAYLAGLFDGEGSIVIRKANRKLGGCGYGLAIMLGVNYKKVIYKIQESFGGSIAIAKSSAQYQWYCCGAKAGDILKLMLPYLEEKKEQAELALDYLSIFGSGNIGGRGVKRTTLEKELQELYFLMMKQLKIKNKLCNEKEVEEEEGGINEEN